MNFADFPAQSLMEITARPPLVFVRGEGSWLWDHQGKRYLDFVQGWAVNCLGHSPKVITEALIEQSRKLITPSPAFYNEPSIALAQRIVKHSCFHKVFFTNSGAEANEGAIKLARKWGTRNKGGAYEIITFEDSFHGRTLATMSASGKPQFREMFEPKVPGFPKAKLNDLASVEKLITDKTVGIMLEPIQGESGVVMATDAFMRDLRELTRKRGLLLIVDEIQTGVGRAGKLWGYEHAGIAPDIMTLGQRPRRRRAARGTGRNRGGVVLRARRPGRDVQRQSAHDRSRLRDHGCDGLRGIYGDGCGTWRLSDEEPERAVDTAWSGRSTRPRSAGRARSEAGHRLEGRRPRTGRRIAAQFAASEFVALHACFESFAGRDRHDGDDAGEGVGASERCAGGGEAGLSARE